MLILQCVKCQLEPIAFNLWRVAIVLLVTVTENCRNWRGLVWKVIFVFITKCLSKYAHYLLGYPIIDAPFSPLSWEFSSAVVVSFVAVVAWGTLPHFRSHIEYLCWRILVAPLTTMQRKSTWATDQRDQTLQISTEMRH